MVLGSSLVETLLYHSSITDIVSFVMIGMLSSLQNLTPSLCIMMLKCIKNISMNSNTLDVLQNASAINTLVQVLGERTSSFDTVSPTSL